MGWEKSKDGGMDFDAGFEKTSNQKRYEEAKERMFSGSTTMNFTHKFNYPEVSHKDYTIPDIISGINMKHNR